MNISYKWLNEYTKIDAQPKDFVHAMNMAGVETTGYIDLGKEIINVVVGKIIKIEKHPNAEKLQICTIDAGQNDSVIIVTGATNVAVGDLVPVALDNSILPGGINIKKSMLRDVESFGMLCSCKELNMSANDYPGAVEDGILILKEGKIGEDIRKTLALDDIIFEVDIVTNRPDCLSMIGVAREAAATFKSSFSVKKPVVKDGKGDINDYLKVTIEDKSLCKRYSARVVTDVKIEPSPMWLVEKLRKNNIRSINNIVDITNYIMLEYGQPMHAFDYDYVSDAQIVVRCAKNSEKITTLDEKEHVLTDEMLVIADKIKPIGLAGIMGGENSEIKNSTKTVVFESANFDGINIRKSSKKLGMRTDSSAYFEKSLDPQMTSEALDRACELVQLLNAGNVVQGVIDLNYADIKQKIVKFEPEWTNNYLGTTIEEQQMREILLSLGFGLENNNIVIPSFRGDIETKYDISEEIARMYGYDNIPTELFKTDTKSGGYTQRQKFEIKLNNLALSLGLSEIITYSFTNPKIYDKLRIAGDDIRRNYLKIQNPIGEDTSVMRTIAISSMLETLSRNINNSNKSASFYEMANTYIKKNNDEIISELPDEKLVFTIGMYEKDKIDFYSIKGVVEQLLNSINIKSYKIQATSENPSYHPGRTAEIYADDIKIGIFGQIHPAVCTNFEIDVPCYCAEISVDALYENLAPERKYKRLPKYPAVTRDLALVCNQDIYSSDVEEKIRIIAGEFLESIDIFDVYQGAQVKTGYKSIAYSLTFRNPEKTLVESDVDAIIQNILNTLKTDDIVLRT